MGLSVLTAHCQKGMKTRMRAGHAVRVLLNLNMSLFGQSPGHFKAIVDIHPCGPRADQRINPPFNGIRWGFVYAEDIETLGFEGAPHSDVWPEFLDHSGHSIETGIPLVGTYYAKMHIVFPHMILKHLERLTIGTEFYCMEGQYRMAIGKVTDLNID